MNLEIIKVNKEEDKGHMMIAYMHNVKKSLKNDTYFFTKQKWESDIKKNLQRMGSTYTYYCTQNTQ